MSRIAATFAALAERKRKGLIPFITAGDPDPELTVPLMHALAGAGADLIELGVPFSDPMADGPTIQRSSERALSHGTSLVHVLGFVSEFRKTNGRTPVVLMGYANPIEAMGYERFAEAARVSGVDGVLVVDYPPEESAQLSEFLEKREIDAIFLLAPAAFVCFGHVTRRIGLANASGVINSAVVVGTMLVGLIFMEEWKRTTTPQFVGLAFTVVGLALILFWGPGAEAE